MAEENKIEFKPGDAVSAYFQDKWQIAKVVDWGRKWAQVKFSHRKRNTKLPITSIRPPPITPIPRPTPAIVPAYRAPAKEPTVAVQNRYGNPAELHMDHFDMFYRIRDGTKPIAMVTAFYKEEAMVVFDAIKKFREGMYVAPMLEANQVPIPTPMATEAPRTAPPAPPAKSPVAAPTPPASPAKVNPPAPAHQRASSSLAEAMTKKKRGRPPKAESKSKPKEYTF